MMTAGRALLTAVGASMRTTSVKVLKPTVVTNPNFPGESSVTWDAATVTATINGILQPVTTDAMRRAGAQAESKAGMIARAGWWTLHTDPYNLSPEGRVRIGTQDYRIVSVDAYATHTEAVIEEVA
jgi:hypothetical protein